MFVESLNTVIDFKEKRKIALVDRVPPEIFSLLLLAAVGSILMTGYAGGVAGTRDLLPSLTASFFIAASIFVITDLHRPHRRFIREPQQALVDLSASMDRPAP